MDRNEARKAAEVMLAYADGKEIECSDFNKGNPWRVVVDPSFNWVVRDYRIKPEPSYRPFKNWVEYLAENRYHKPYDAVCYADKTCLIIAHTDSMIRTYYAWYSFKDAFKQLTFADGTPFGIKDE